MKRIAFSLFTVIMLAIMMLPGASQPVMADPGRTINWATLTYDGTTVPDGESSITVPPGASITATLNVTTTGSGEDDDWRSTRWRIATTPPGSMTCANTTDFTSAGDHTASFTIYAPTTAGTYNAYFRAHQYNWCYGDYDSITLTEAIVVEVEEPEPNPELEEACGFDIVLVMDESASIEDDDFAQMQAAFVGFVNALLSGTPAELALVDCGTIAHPRLSGDFTSDATTINNAINEPRLNSTAQYTNWEQALVAAHGLFLDRGNLELVIFASDGSPNAYGSGGGLTTGFDLATQAAALAAAIGAANDIKSDGIRIITIGIGDVNEDNLAAISSTDAVYTTDFDGLVTTLATLDLRVDNDEDGVYAPPCGEDKCDDDPLKTDPGICGCGVPDTDSDGDGTADCIDGCPDDPDKTEPGVCGCGVPDTDSDQDGTPDCNDQCPDDPGKTDPGVCGCGVPDVDTDGDGTLDCNDGCPSDPLKTDPGQCGCGVPDTDSDGDGTADCIDGCPDDPDKTEPGICGCGVPDVDTDGDGTLDCNDGCPEDPGKTEPGICGCGTPDTDSDDDSVPGCNDCDDSDPNNYPGNTEDCTDEKDNDCDGLVDCEDEDCAVNANAGPDRSIRSGGSTEIGGDPSGNEPTASGGTPDYTYSWDPTDGLDDPTIANPTASPTSTTTYSVLVTDVNGCSDSDSMRVTVTAIIRGGGGGGGGAAAECYLSIDMLGEITKVELNCCKNSPTEDCIAFDPDELHFLEIQEDTEIICGDCEGCRCYPRVLVMSLTEEEPPAPDDMAIVALYDFTGYEDTKRLTVCDEATFFDPPISMLLSYDPETLPEGAFSPVIAFYDAEQGLWVELPADTGIVAEVGKVTGLADRFASPFAVLVNVPPPSTPPPPPPPAPAHFVVSSLNIAPPEIEVGENVIITVNVVNDGGQEGTYLVELKISGETVDSKEVTLGAGQGEQVSFTVSGTEPGQYEVVVSGLSGEFTVLRTINWWLIGGIIAAIIILGSLGWYLRKRLG